MNGSILKIGTAATLATLAAALLAMTVGAAGASARPPAKNPLAKNGVIYACFKVKGKNRGALRVVRHPRNCRKLRGWHRTAWSAVGLPGSQGGSDIDGSSSVPGPPGPAGATGDAGEQGVAGTVEKTLIETIQAQSTQIDELTEQVTTLTGQVTSLTGGVAGLEGDLGSLEGTVSGLGGDLVGLESTVESACAQLELVTDQTDSLLAAVGGISLSTLLAVLLEIPPLPAALGTFECG